MYQKKIIFGLLTLVVAGSSLFVYSSSAASPMSLLGDDISIIGKLTTGGSVGIGTTGPGGKLDVSGGYASSPGTGARTTALKISANGNTPDAAQIFWGDNTGWKLHFGTVDSGGVFQPRMSIVDTGSVGIGTKTPQRKLDLSNAGQLTFGNDVVTNSTNGIYWHAGSTYSIARTAGTWTAPTYQQLLMQFATGIVIDGGSAYAKSGTILQPNGGNVGIGATSPRAKLDVNGQIIGGFGAATTAGILNWNDATNARPGSGYTLLLGTATNGPGPTGYYHPFSFEYSTKTGAGNLTQFAIPYAVGSGLDTGIYFRGRYSGVWSSWRKILSENANGNVGIGTTAPTAKLDINGDKIRIEIQKTPASSTAPCSKGEIAWDANAIYVCVATNTWKKAALGAF